MSKIFDLKQTNIAKGIAVLMLVWHHLFFNDPEKYGRFTSVLWFHNMPVESFIADFFKACVAIFIFISGYGLCLSYEKKVALKQLSFKNAAGFVKNRMIKLYSGFWVVYLLFVPLSLFFGTSFIETYAGNPIYYIGDFLGISYITNGFDHMVNATWWYMTVIIVYTLCFPLIHRLFSLSPEVMLLFSLASLLFLPRNYELAVWIFPLVTGMYFYRRGLFEKLEQLLDHRIKKCCVSLLMILCFAFIRWKFSVVSAFGDTFLGIGIILFSLYFISRIPFFNRVLEELGKKSGLIFMFHTFIYSRYFGAFIYSFKNSVLIYIVMMVICYLVAAILDYLMKVTHYNNFIKKLCNERQKEKL